MERSLPVAISMLFLLAVMSMSPAVDAFAILPSRRAPISTILSVTRDAYLQSHFEPVSTSTILEDPRVVQCIEEDDLCSVEEMTNMIQNLENLQRDCEELNPVNPYGCDVNQMERAQNLQASLKSQINKQKNEDDVDVKALESENASEDRSFDHFVDYHFLGEYESH